MTIKDDILPEDKSEKTMVINMNGVCVFELILLLIQDFA